MPFAGRLVTAVLAWTVAAVVLSWGRLPDHARRALALLTSALGVLALVFAFGSEGQREMPTTAQFLLSGGYVTGHVSASASLRYYVVTAVCLFLGTLGLAVPDEVAQRMERRWVAAAVVLSLAVTALRFALEQVAAPPSWTTAVGITWLAPVVGATFHGHLRRRGGGVRALLKYLLVYALAVRGAVAALMVVATRLHLGSHYDLTRLTSVRLGSGLRHFEPGSWTQIAMLGVGPQLTFWVFYTMVAGLLGAGALALVQRARSTERAPSAEQRHRDREPLPPDRPADEVGL